MKIFKLLVNELGNLNESILLDEDEENTDDDDDSQDNILNSGENGIKTIRTSDLWEDEDDEEDDDPLLKELEQDPIFKSSMNENLTNFLQNFTKTEQFVDFAQHLNDYEKGILGGIHG